MNGGSSQSKDEDPTIVLGLDFGTTWDSVNYHCTDKEKTPSVISYDEDGKLLWGYSVSDKKSSIQWFKLCLLEEDDIPKDIRNSTQLQAAKASLKQRNKSAVDVISDYLRELWKHSILNIRRAIGGQLVDLCRFKVVATLPAIWPAYAQIRMYEAMEKAGILKVRTAGGTTLEFLSEPEAASLATMNGMSMYNKADVKIGDHFVVCDAGGGTVDVITYTVMELDPMRVQESVKGDGKLCGATFLDERFLSILREKLNEMSPDAWQILEEAGALGRIINSDWENGIKPQFRNTNQHWVIQMPVGGPKRTHDEFRFSDVKLDVKDVQKIFKPIVSEIKHLVATQVRIVEEKYKKKPKFVVLVGGFGRQPLLYTEIQDDLNSANDLEGKIDVLQSQGAEPIHDERDMMWSKVDQAFVADNQTTWFVSIGETIPVGEFTEKAFYNDIEKPIKSLSTDLIYSTSAIPSKRRDETVKELYKLHWSSVPDFHSLPTWINPKGQTIRRICFSIRMTSNGVTLDFEVLYGNKVMASKKIGIDYGHCGAPVGISN
ncbi:hypothetical protein ACHAQJ_004818 [Trichoderma viride]